MAKPKKPTRQTRKDRFFLYMESRCVDNSGWPEPRHMNAEDLVFANEYEDSGHVVNHGTGINQRWRLTDSGYALAARLRRDRAERLWKRGNA
jgi:hypothetical protein